MTVYLVGAGPGDPGLLTRRGAEVLGRCDVVVYDRLSVAALLDLAPVTAERISVGKAKGGGVAQIEINQLLVERGRLGQEVVRLKGGDPFVFARGGEEAAALADAGVAFEVVPGITSAVAVPAYAGIPVTGRGVATSFTVVTGHEDPWAATETDWDAVAALGGTIVILMGASTRADIAARLMKGGLASDTPVAAVTWGTRPEQRTVRTTLAGLGDVAVDAPATIVVGAVAAIDMGWFEHRPLHGKQVVVTRPAKSDVALADALHRAGASVIAAPAIEIVRPADGGAALVAAATAVGSFDWVVFTSANAVEHFTAHLHDARAFGPARVAAIGPATAARLRAAGVEPDLVPTRYVAEALVEDFPDGPGRVLVPQSAGARPTLVAGLRAKGWTVDAVEAYDTTAVGYDDETLAAVRNADAVAFASSSAVDAFIAAVGGRDNVPPVVACIGPITAATARGRGLTVHVEADDHSGAGLAAALIAWWVSHPTHPRRISP